MVGIELAPKLTTIKWQKKIQFTITQYSTEQNNIIQIFEVSLMPIRADSNEQQKPIDRFIGGIATL